MMIKTCLIALFCVAVLVEGQGDETASLKSVEAPSAQVKNQAYDPGNFDITRPRVQRSTQMHSDTTSSSQMSLDDDEDLKEDEKSFL